MAGLGRVAGQREEVLGSSSSWQGVDGNPEQVEHAGSRVGVGEVPVPPVWGS